MSDGFHPPLEEYLEAVHELEEEGIEVIQARLAERLGHSAPSVSEMIRRLRADGYLEPSGKAVRLTTKGRKLAESVVRKHRLAERLLTDVIGLAWNKAHVEACRWEHVISDEVEERLVVLLGNPATCPHGNPIPGTANPVDDSDYVPLLDAVPGPITITRISEKLELNDDALAILAGARLIPGAAAEVVEVTAGGVRLKSPSKEELLPPEIAREMFVRPV